MRIRSLAAAGVAACLAITAYGCSDGATGPRTPISASTSTSHLLAPGPGPGAPTPPPPVGPGTPPGPLPAPTPITPLTRITRLAADVNVSQQIGPLGGTIIVPGTGLTLIVPPLAVSKPTAFTVHASQGDRLAYDFGPHLQFTVPVIVVQDLRNTQAGPIGLVDPLSVFLGYFPDASQNSIITELQNAGINIPDGVAVAPVWHFSGYIWASGRGGR